MASLVPNIAKGRAAALAALPATNDALIGVPIKAGTPLTDELCRDAASLAAILTAGTVGGVSPEQTTMGRKTLTGVTVTVDNTVNEVQVNAARLSWTAAQMATAGGPVARLVICYDPDTTTGTDADLVPLVVLDMNAIPDGNAFEYVFATNGFYAATE